MRTLFSIACILALGGLPPAQAVPLKALFPDQTPDLVARALANEASAAQDSAPDPAQASAHPARYLLTKTTPRLSTTREIYETKDGDVARLLTVNGKPLSPEAEQKEQSRLKDLAGNPSRQRHRKEAEEADRGRALQVLRALPTAFLYRYAGTENGPGGPVVEFTFRPNPSFSPPNVEARVLAAMSGAIWIDSTAARVVRLQGRLDRDVDFGWGIVGRLNKGGTIEIRQAEVLPGQWRTVRLTITMAGRVFFKTRNFDLIQVESQFAVLPAGIGYKQAIAEMEHSGQ